MINEFEGFERFEELKKAIEKVKFGEDIKSYKTGSSNNVTKRIELFTLGVHQLID